MREDRGRIVYERVRPKRYELSELLKGITNKDRHRTIDLARLLAEKFGDASEVHTGSW